MIEAKNFAGAQKGQILEFEACHGLLLARETYRARDDKPKSSQLNPPRSSYVCTSTSVPDIKSSCTIGSEELECTQFEVAEVFRSIDPQSTLPTCGTTVLSLPAEEIIR